MTVPNILVTGAAGFLGRHVLERLRGNVFAIDNMDPLCGGGPGPRRLDALDVRSLQKFMQFCSNKKITHIIHLAAYGRNLTCQDHPLRAWKVNVDGTLNVLYAGLLLKNQIKRVICCSSNIVLSDQPTVYKATKKACEDLIALYASMGVSCMGLRPSNIYGTGQSKKEYQLCAFAGLDKSYSETGKFKITGDGSQCRDWVHADDVARAFELALASDVRGETLDICTGIRTSMKAVAEMLGVPVEYVPARANDARELISHAYDGDKIGFRAEIYLRDRIRDAFPSVP